VRRSALKEAAHSFGRALALLETLPVSNERHEQEVRLRIAMGGVLMASRGWGATAVEPMYVRARELCGQLGDTPQLFAALWGLWLFYWGRGSLATARHLAQDLHRLARKVDDRSLLLQAYHALWATSFSVGEIQEAHEYAAAGTGLYVQEDHFPLVTSYGNHDAAVCAHVFDARALALLGQTITAVHMVERGVALARHLGHPFTLALALVLGAAVHQFRRDAAAVARYASEATVLCREQSFPLVLAWGMTFEGWAAVENNPRGDGAFMIAEGIDRARATGSDQFLPHLLGVAADAHFRTASVEPGLSAIEEAHNVTERTGERFYEAELHRLEGELRFLRDRRHKAEAAAAFEHAIQIGRAQGSRLLVLRALVSLGRLRQSEDRFREVRPMLEEAVTDVDRDPSLLDLREATRLLGYEG
jgi:predicted ATPase